MKKMKKNEVKEAVEKAEKAEKVGVIVIDDQKNVVLGHEVLEEIHKTGKPQMVDVWQW